MLPIFSAFASFLLHHLLVLLLKSPFALFYVYLFYGGSAKWCVLLFPPRFVYSFFSSSTENKYIHQIFTGYATTLVVQWLLIFSWFDSERREKIAILFVFFLYCLARFLHRNFCFILFKAATFLPSVLFCRQSFFVYASVLLRFKGSYQNDGFLRQA